MQIQKYHVQDILPQGHYLLKQIGLEGGGTCAATRPETMEEVVEGDGGREPDILNRRHYLPHHLHKANLPVVRLPLGNQDHSLPRGLLPSSLPGTPTGLGPRPLYSCPPT